MSLVNDQELPSKLSQSIVTKADPFITRDTDVELACNQLVFYDFFTKWLGRNEFYSFYDWAPFFKLFDSVAKGRFRHNYEMRAFDAFLFTKIS